MEPNQPSAATRMFFAILVAAALVVIAMGVQAIAWITPWFRTHALHVTLAATLLALASRAPLESVARAQLGLRGPVALWTAMTIAAVAQAAVLALELDASLGERLGFLATNRHLWELQPGAAIIPIAALIAARAASGPVQLEGARRRQAALVAAGVASALLAMGVLRAWRAAPIDQFVRSLPELARVTAPVEREAPGVDRNESIRYADTRLASRVLRRYRFADRAACAWRLGSSAEALPETTAITYERLLSCDDVVVREHRESATIVLSSARAADGGEFGAHLAFRAADGAVLPSAERAEHRRAMSAPRSWIGPSAVALILAWTLLRRARRAARALETTGQWKAGTLRADGMIAFDDGAVVAAPYGLDLRAGPVVLTEPNAQPGAAFREGAVRMAKREAIFAGSIADGVATIEARVDALHMTALFAALASAAPWIGALFAGLLL